MNRKVMLHRRVWLKAGVCTAVAAAWPSLAESTEFSARVEALERQVGGRIGVYALDLHNEQAWAYRADERFAMCSTFKWLLAAQLLSLVDHKVLALNDRVRLERADLLEYAPVCARYLSRGSMSLRQLAQAAVLVSDNTAANLLLRRMGGPPAFTAFARSLGDTVTRLDRIEPELNSNDKDDVRDTTTARAMVACMRAALVGDALSASSRLLLRDWMRACETGTYRLRAGLPANWKVGDKTGTGSHHAVNDVAIAFPPRRKPVLMAVYLSDSERDMPTLNAVHADIAKLVASSVVHA